MARDWWKEEAWFCKPEAAPGGHAAKGIDSMLANWPVRGARALALVGDERVEQRLGSTLANAEAQRPPYA
jgi:hypothetical protein